MCPHFVIQAMPKICSYLGHGCNCRYTPLLKRKRIEEHEEHDETNVAEEGEEESGELGGGEDSCLDRESADEEGGEARGWRRLLLALRRRLEALEHDLHAPELKMGDCDEEADDEEGSDEEADDAEGGDCDEEADDEYHDHWE